MWRWGDRWNGDIYSAGHGPRTRGTLSGFTIPIPVFWSVIWDAGQWTARSFSTTVIADAQTGAAVGFIDCRDSEPVYLSLFLLDAALQGKGLGTELYREFEEMQRRRGRKGIRIDVVDDYEGNLVPFWKRRGFEEGEEITLEWGGKASRARVMYRDLI